MKKPLSLLTLLCLLLTPGLSAVAEAGGAHAVESRTMNFYYFSPDTAVPVAVRFFDGADVPYLALSDWPAIMRTLADTNPENSAISVPAFSMAGNVGVLTQADGYSADFDCDADTIHFLDYDAYMRAGGDAFIIDMLDGISTVDADGRVHYFARSANSYQRYGSEVTIDAGAYGIDFIAEGGECYVPMQTLSDILMSYHYANIYYNGELAIVAGLKAFGDYDKGQTPLGELYFSVQPHPRSETMARFTYAELCMALDTLYGLKGNHGIADFDTLVGDTGLAQALKGTDPAEADAALYQLLMQHLDDQHTRMFLPSPASGFDAGRGFADA